MKKNTPSIIKTEVKLFTVALVTGTALAPPTTLANETAQTAIDIRHERLKEKFESLPPQAKRIALDRLRTFDVPTQDHQFLDFDADGEVLYIDPHASDVHTTENSATEAQLTEDHIAFDTIDAAQAFSLHSNPGAPNTLIVDFDGHTISGTGWNSTYSTLQAAAYDTDGNPNSFSQSELTEIAHIWHRIAEDFAGFDVNVTTEEPSQLNSTTGRILITKGTDTTGKPMPYGNYGGVAYLGVWGRSDFHTRYSPALVYYNNLGGVHNIAEAASHEAGHNLSLSHDGKTDGTGYYGGHGSGYTKWGPIMGVGYYGHVTQWSKGDYSQANNTEDDLAILANHLSLRSDDHGDNTSNATPLLINSDGSISHTTPETDPFNLNIENRGIIGHAGDTDFFMLDLGAGDISLSITPAWAAFHTSGNRGSNLDIKARLLDGSGKSIAQSAQTTDTQALVSATLTAGTFYLEVSRESTGDPNTGYDDYASLGHYYIAGSAVPGDGSSKNGPSDEPPVANNDSYTVTEDSVTILDVLANDTDPEASALDILAFSQPSNGNLDLQNDQLVYTPNADFNGVSSFTYSITDFNGNTASASVSLTVSAVNDAPVANNDTLTTEADTPASIDLLSNDSDVDGDTLSVSIITGPSNGTISLNNGTVSYTPASAFIGTDSFTYQVRDPSGSSDTATVTITVTEKLEPPTTPTGLAVSDIGSGVAGLSWSDTNNETNYEVQREYYKTKGKQGWAGTTALTIGANLTQLQDSPGNNGTYRYRIRSLNALGASNWSGWQNVDINSVNEGGDGSTGNRGKKK
jgi:hypothetical protein